METSFPEFQGMSSPKVFVTPYHEIKEDYQTP